jgi:hypothetical protein
MTVDANPDDTAGDRRREHRPKAQSFWPPPGWVALGFMVVGGYFLITEHAAHLASIRFWSRLAR